jgi:hypothetical protein
MKTLFTLHYSGYPPAAGKTNQQSKPRGADWIAIKPQAKEVKRKQNELANNPNNWDESWFSNYE